MIIDRHPADRVRVARRREPVTCGIPLPQGAAHDATGWQLVDAADRALPLQTRILDRWADRSTRWLLIDSQVDVPAGETVALQLIAGPPGPPAPSAPLTPAIAVQESDSGVVIDTGGLRLRVRLDDPFPFGDVTMAETEVLDATASGLTLVDRAGRSYRATVQRASVLESGSVRVSIAIDGRISHGSLDAVNVRARLDLYAGLSTVRLSVRLRNPGRARHPDGFWDLGDAGSIYVRDASLTFALRSGPGSTDVQCSPEIGEAWRACDVPFELYQDSSGGDNWRSHAHVNRERRVPNSFRGYRLAAGATLGAGLRATPIVSVARASRHVTLAVPHFWQNFPKAVEASEHALVLRLFPGQYADVHELQGGEQKTHECFVAFAPDAVTEAPLEWCRARVLAHTDPSWNFSTNAVPWLGDDDPEHRALVWTAIDGADTFERKRETVDEYGWRHFGDIYGDHEAIRHPGPIPLVSHYNNQYDPIAGFTYQYLRTGDARWATMAAELAAHVIDIDVYHTERDKWAYNHGLFWHTYHYGDADTSSHRTYPRAARGIVHGGGPSPDHNYTTGLMLHYFLTGDPAAKETVVDLARFVIDADDGAKTVFRWLSRAHTGFATASGSYAYHGPGRGPANSLNALIDGHRLTGDATFLAKSEQLIRRVVHPHDNVDRHQLGEPEHKWFYLVFLQSVGKYLAYKADLAQIDVMYGYARASLLQYARWMAVHEYPYLERPDKLIFPTETWAAHEIRKSDVFYLAALYAIGAERDRFVERGQFFFRNCIETLRAMPTRTLARPVIVLLSSGLMHPWFSIHADAIAPPPSEPEPDYGRPVTFVPQKQQAKKRAMLLAIALGALMIGGLSMMAYWVN